MGTKYKTHPILEVVLLFVCLAGLLARNAHADDDSQYLKAVREFADNVLKYGRDTYGPKHTPLFVDGLNINTHEPVKWIAPNGDRWILSNLASQQNLFRTLDGLTKITGDPKYRQAAMEAIKYAFENLRSPNGLLYWGGYAAYDALGDGPCGGGLHVFKGFLPYYELMWEISPEATSQLIESLWACHILDWSNLAMNRYGPLDKLSVPKGWEHEYKEGPVFFESNGAPFATTGSDLYYAAAILSKLSGKKEPLIWAKRLVYRYVETRYPKIGISSYVYTLPRNPPKHPLADDLRGHMVQSGILFPPAIEQILDPRVRKCKLGYFMVSPGIPYTPVANPWICSLLVGELLGDEGKEFTQLALEDLTARGKVSYRRSDNVWIPMLPDGTSLEGYTYKKDEMFGPKGTVFKPISAEPMDFWGYALAYRLTTDEFMWKMACCIAQGNGLGDIGAAAEDKPRLQIPSNHFDPYTLLAFLELYRKTEKTKFLHAAQEVGDNILVIRFHKGFFVPSDKHIYSKLDAIEALALLHLDSTIRQKDLVVPQVWPGRPLFNQPFRDKEIVVDNALIYNLTETPEPPRSLQEAAACGDIEEVKSLIAWGADVNSIESLLLCTPLYHAVLNGHKDVVALLLAEGAKVDGRDAFPGGTALHYAAEKGYTEIAELLLAQGADVNAKRGYPAGDTPLHSAARAGHKDIVELLIAKGADVNAKNNNGQTPLDVAVSRDRNEIVKLLITKGADISFHAAARFGDLAIVRSLIEKGADINEKDASGQTPIDVAFQRRRENIVELLIEKGADVSSIYLAAYLGDTAKVMNFIEQGIDVNTKDKRGLTPLHYAARQGHKEIVEMLLANGADVNSGDRYNSTAAEYAMGNNYNEVVELLVSKGADISPLHLALYMKDEAKAKSLIDGGADFNKWTPYGTTPLHRATSAGFKDLAEQLIAKGADVNAKDNWNWTPLHGAAYYGNRDIVELLIAKGADVNARDGDSRTPLWYAKDKGYAEIVELLRKHGAKE